MKEFYTFILSFVVITAFIACVLMVVIGGVTRDQTLIGQAFGAMQALGGTAIGYYVGTNKSSSDKDKTIQTMAQTAQPQSDAEKEKRDV